MKPIKTFLIIIHLFCLFAYLSCDGTIVDGDGSDSKLKNTEWISHEYFTPDYQPCHFFIKIDNEGVGGNYYHFEDSCYVVDTMKLWYGSFLIDSNLYRYDISGDFLRVFYPKYAAWNPDSVIGEIGILYTRIDIDTLSLQICE